jgi:hypothetical protein
MNARLGRPSWFLPVLFLATTVFVPGNLQAAEATGASKAEEAVREALQREIYGLVEDRDSLLNSAVDTAPNNSAARWHQGYVRGAKGDWVVGGEPTDKSYQELLALYGKLRTAASNTVAGQLDLADWCARKNLKERERVHLLRVCELAPNHVAARQRLGFVRVGRDWVSRADLNLAQNRDAAMQTAAAHWGPIIGKLAAQLGLSDAKKREAAVLQIKAIRDATALPTLQQLVGTRGEREELLVVEVAGQINETDATVALARHAVLSPSLTVRQAAAKLLSSREREAYVPLLLSMMYSPVVSQISEFALPNGQVGYRHAFMREGAERNEVLVLDTQYRRVAETGGTPNGNAALSLNRAARDAQRTAAQMEQGVAAQNQATAALNDRLAWVLNTATSANLPADPDRWWKWWSEENEVFVAGSKQYFTESRSRTVDIVEVDPRSLIPPPESNMRLMSVTRVQQPLFVQRTDCLVAGTPVWTDRGTVAIEKVLAGDMVLSRDIESGELAYKPVLQTTVRPEGPIIKVQAGDEVFESSGGHPFWVSGDGWVKSRNLKSGMILHTASGPIRVTDVSEARPVPTFNLVVADFNTYFVGNQKVLSHDNTVRRPTNVVVPGLKAQ